LIKLKKNKKDDIVFATAIQPLFAAKKLAEDTGVLSHTSYFEPKSTGKDMKKSGSGIKVIKMKAAKKVPNSTKIDLYFVKKYLTLKKSSE